MVFSGLEKTVIPEDTLHVSCLCMCIAALFTTARAWKHPKCPSTEEWIKKMWYIYTMEYYLAIKRNETVPFAEMWMDLDCHKQWRQSERSKQISYINVRTWNLEKWYGWTYLQSGSRDTDVENKHVDSKGRKGRMGETGRWRLTYTY